MPGIVSKGIYQATPPPVLTPILFRLKSGGNLFLTKTGANFAFKQTG